MKKREVKLGEVVPGTHLRALEHRPSDARGNQRVLVRCELCGKEKEMRVSAMTHGEYVDRNDKRRKPARSCGCESIRTCREFWEKRANGIPRRVQRKIYFGHQWYHKSFKALGKEFTMEEQLASTCFRVYAQRLKGRRRLR